MRADCTYGKITVVSINDGQNKGERERKGLRIDSLEMHSHIAGASQTKSTTCIPFRLHRAAVNEGEPANKLHRNSKCRINSVR